MRLTVEHLRRAPQFTNTILQREIDLRGLCISDLDGNALLHLQNEFDVLNLCNNSLSALESFPTPHFMTGKSAVMTRLSTIIVHKNRLHKVNVETCVRVLPGIRYFAADKNNFNSVRDLVFLHYWKDLEVVSLQHNPFWKSNPEGLSAEEIRAFLCFLCSNLRLIDYERVTQAERQNAAANSSKFAKLVEQWRGVDALLSGKKSRKRGRGKESNSLTAVTSTSATNVKDEEEWQHKLARINARLIAEDTTAEELEQLEREMVELSGNG